MPGKSYRLSLTARAQRDLADIRSYTIKKHGARAATSYNALLRQAFRDILADPFRPGSRSRPEIGDKVRSFHIAFSRSRAASDVRTPRHFVLYLLALDNEIVVSRVLHDVRDIPLHVPQEDIDKASNRQENE